MTLTPSFLIQGGSAHSSSLPSSQNHHKEPLHRHLCSHMTELEHTEDQRNPSLVNLGAMVGVVVATAVLITPVYVMLIFLWWKKR